ncbi:MAG: aquaporin [Armatimonadetes bacterium]|nr:aquaporin [Armatimonadota bacterium]
MVKRYVAEFVGSFMIVAAPIWGAFAGLGLSEMAWISGLAVMAMIYVFGPVSAAHFNPAVTLGFAVAKRFPWKHVAPYVLCQIAGGIAAAALGSLALKPGLGVHVPATQFIGRNIATEFLVTFALMAVIMAVATDRRVSGAIPGVAIGLTVVLGVLVGGSVTGGSMNPARSLGPALMAGGEALNNVWLYLSIPPLGAVAAAVLFEYLRLEPEHAKGAPDGIAAEVTD